MNKEINYENLLEELNQPENSNYFEDNLSPTENEENFKNQKNSILFSNNTNTNNKFLGKKRVNQNFHENQEKNFYSNFENNKFNSKTNLNKKSEYDYSSINEHSKLIFLTFFII